MSVSKYLFELHYDPAISPEVLFKEHQAFGVDYPPLPRPRRSPKDKIRVAYLSGDFRVQVCACFLLPLLAAHDRSRVEIYCYDNGRSEPDAVTALFQKISIWRPISKLSDEDVIAQIAADEIDILIDCAGHSAGKRLSVFAKRPAPVTMTFLGYPDTTGLSQIDYRLTDAVADPLAEGNSYATEELVRMPNGFHTYRPLGVHPAPNDLPCLNNEFVTFCSFNKRLKINDDVLALWARVLEAVPKSRLLLKNRQWKGRPYLGVDPDRVMLLPHAEMYHDHFAAYHMADIALDTFPYSGTTTTCDALWMGVPVVTLYGRHHAARASASLLSRVGLADLISHSADEYVAIASRLAQDRAQLTNIRSTLRQRVLNSPLGNPKIIARDLEKFFAESLRRADAEQS